MPRLAIPYPRHSVWLKRGRRRWVKKAGLGIGKECQMQNENDKTFLLVHSPFFISHSFRFLTSSFRNNHLKFLLGQRHHRELCLPNEGYVLQTLVLLHFAESDRSLEGLD